MYVGDTMIQEGILEVQYTNEVRPEMDQSIEVKKLKVEHKIMKKSISFTPDVCCADNFA